MRRLPQHISLIAVSVFALGTLVATPAFAEGSTGMGDSGSLSTKSMSTESGSGSMTGSSDMAGMAGMGAKTTDPSMAQRTETESNQVATKSSDLKTEAEQLLNQERAKVKATSLAERQKACQAHQAEITRRSQAYVLNGKRQLDVFNGIYAKVLAFQADKKLTATNFAQLKAAADAQQASATAAVAALSGTNVTVDCTSSDPAASVATLKTAVSNARTALQNYRQAIKNVIVALQSAESAANTSGTTKTGGNQ